MEFLQRMGRAMFREPLLAHPAESGGVHATGHSQPGDDDDRDRRDDDGDDEQHMVLTAFAGTTILTGGSVTVCALVHSASGTRNVAAILRGGRRRAFGNPAGLACHAQTFRDLRVHSRTARFNAEAYT